MLLLKPSGIEGVGVFTTQPIRKDQDPGLFPANDWKEVKSSEVKGTLRKYCVTLKKKGYLSCPKEPHRMSLAWYLNHSDKPNIDHIYFTALRHIKAGEELTIDYGALEPR